MDQAECSTFVVEEGVDSSSSTSGDEGTTTSPSTVSSSGATTNANATPQSSVTPRTPHAQTSSPASSPMPPSSSRVAPSTQQRSRTASVGSVLSTSSVQSLRRNFMQKQLSPFPPPPSNESIEDRQSRELVECTMAILHLHNEIWKVDNEDSKVFLAKVDTTFAPNYHDVIKKPMDLSKIGRRIRNGTYTSAWKYLDDMHLMLENCMLYNKAGTFHNRYANKILKIWQPRAEEMLLETLAYHNYCCGKRRVLSGFSYRCRGATCFIKYGCVYWYYDPEDGDDDIIFCQSHYQRLSHEITMPRFGNGTGGDITFKKDDLVRAKHNTPLVPERLIKCKDCGHEDHEICRLHMPWANDAESSPLEYLCDRCWRAQGLGERPVHWHSPRVLPECHLSKVLQREVSMRVPLVGQRVCVRVVEFEQETVERKPLLKEKYPDVPSSFAYIKKIVLCFMDIEGRPVCFFAMVLHEYGQDCAEPNRGRAYLSLLDSVKLPKTMLPSTYRTAIYHSIVRGYLREAGTRGFKACHIYTCPPRKGQNYIFPFKPDDQKEISVVRLRKWYADLLTSSITCDPPAIRGFKNIGEVFPKPSLVEIPYFDGDNWPDILEDILKIDQKVKDQEKMQQEISDNVERIAAEIARTREVEPKHVKPRPLAAGYYEGMVPPKKKRKVEPKRPVKPKLTLDQRMHMVLSSSKRDFLVVELINNSADSESAQPATATVSRDPDLDVDLPTIGGEHTVGTWLRSEKLEFSSLRHAKFSTMLLVYALLRKGTVPERFPDPKSDRKAMLLNISATTDHDTGSVSKMEDGDTEHVATDGGGGEGAAAFAADTKAASNDSTVLAPNTGDTAADGSAGTSDARPQHTGGAGCTMGAVENHPHTAAQTPVQPITDAPLPDPSPPRAATGAMPTAHPTGGLTQRTDVEDPPAAHDAGHAAADTVDGAQRERKRSASQSSTSSSDSTDSDRSPSQEAAETPTSAVPSKAITPS
eukprot:m.644358 g.644358  ORF g.644358 m.644358 type:complete len:981 (+) comp22648_c0_seq2:318-3260(+)